MQARRHIPGRVALSLVVLAVLAAAVAFAFAVPATSRSEAHAAQLAVAVADDSGASSSSSSSAPDASSSTPSSSSSASSASSASSSSASSASSAKPEAAPAGVRYVAILGADTWKAADGTYYAPSSDLTGIVRVDYASGIVSFLTIPRDMRYDNVKNYDADAQVYKLNKVFYNAFNKKIKADYSNYAKAIHAAAKTTCKALTDVTGISIKDYAVVDLYTYQDLTKAIGGVNVKIPIGIKNYRLYTDGKFYSVNEGEPGKFTLKGWDAMVACRARMLYSRDPFTNALLAWENVSDYTGNVPELLVRKIRKDGTEEPFYHFCGDAMRQFLNRRTFGALVNKGLGRSEGATSFVWNQLIKTELIWTNLAKDDVKTMAKGLTKAKKAGKLTIYGSSALCPAKGRKFKLNGISQYLIPMDAQNRAQLKATVEQFKAGEPMTCGWGYETILKTKVGIAKGATKKADGFTYKATGSKTVAMVKAPNVRDVVIPASVELNGQTYLVTQTAAESVKGGKVRSVTLGDNIWKLAEGTFTNSRVVVVKAKSTLLNREKIRAALKGCTQRVSIRLDDEPRLADILQHGRFVNSQGIRAS